MQKIVIVIEMRNTFVKNVASIEEILSKVIVMARPIFESRLCISIAYNNPIPRDE